MQSTKDVGLRLNLGCWKFKVPGFVNVDIDPDFGDVVADARSLPFPDSSVDEIYAGHLLEHFSFDEHASLLNEWRRVLKPGGTLTVTVPDVEKALRLVREGNMGLPLLASVVFGAHDRKEQEHKSVFDLRILLDVLGDFNDLRELPSCPHAPFSVGWQTIVSCKK